jgi:hypothetical protein
MSAVVALGRQTISQQIIYLTQRLIYAPNTCTNTEISEWSDVRWFARVCYVFTSKY